MVLTSERLRSSPRELIWHELECGGYEADLSLWLELAKHARGPVLDIGAGSGRVACVLARAGFYVTALERRRALLDALRERNPAIECVLADARRLSLARRDYALCVVPMHTLQLFGGASRREHFLRRAHEHLRSGAVLAAAILPDAEPFDAALGHLVPEPESTVVGGVRFISAPTRVAVEADAIVIERLRRIRTPPGRPTPALVRTRDVLARITPEQLGAEALAAGFSDARVREIPATDEHVASQVVIVRA